MLMYRREEMGTLFGLAVFIVLILILPLCSVERVKCSAEQETDTIGHEEECLYEIGAYERKAYFFKLYKVSFQTIEPARIAEMYCAQQEEGGESKCSLIDSLADFLLDPQNRIPLKLTVETLRSSITYDVQKKSMCKMLERAGYRVDENWNLVGARKHQDDVKLYVKTMIGLNSKENKRLCKTIKKGDLFILSINEKGKASVTYRPGKKNRIAHEKHVCFASSQVLRGIFVTYLSNEACSSDLKGSLPNALMERIVSAYENTKQRGVVSKY